MVGELTLTHGVGRQVGLALRQIQGLRPVVIVEKRGGGVGAQEGSEPADEGQLASDLGRRSVSLK